MSKIDSTVRRETLYIAAWTLVLSAVLQAVSLILGRWDYRVLLGNVLGGGAAVLNFFLMGLTVQSCLGMDPAEARTRMRASQIYRMLMLFGVGLVGALVPVFSVWAVLIPYFFPRLVITCRYFALKRAEKAQSQTGGENL